MKEIALKYIYKKLAAVAKKVISKHQPFVIAITGSVGKTSTKEAIAAVLRHKYGDNVRYTHGNLNAEIGVPLTILGYSRQPSKKEWPKFLLGLKKHIKEKTYPAYLVVEMGVEYPGDICSFCDIAQPDIAVITAATPAHLVNFADLAAMQVEKLSISKCLKPGGKVIYNADDQYLNKHLQSSGCAYSMLNSQSGISARDIRVGIEGNCYTLISQAGEITIESKLLGRQMIYSDLAAAAVAGLMGFPLMEIKKGLESRQPYAGRFNLLPGVRGIKIIDDTYNANPHSVKAAVDALQEIPYVSGRKVIILGNMNELGEESLSEHLKMAKYIDGKADLIVFAGPNAEAMAAEIKKSAIIVYSNRQEIENNIDRFLNDRDLVLIKASQNKNYFEELVKILLTKNINPSDVLVRQGREWLGKKSKY